MPDLSGGNAFVDVMPSMRGYFQRVRREIQSNPVEHEIQPTVDQRQLEKARQQVEQASAKVEAARRKEADATGAVAVAEAKLQALVDRGVTDAGRLATARENVAKATRRQEAAAQALQAAESGQRSAEGRVLRVQARLDSAEAETQTDSFFQRMTGRARAFGGGFSGILKGAATGAVAAVGLLSTQMGEVLERGNLQRSLRAQLDLTAEESKRAGSIAGNVFAQNYGSSMAEVTDAVGAVAGSMSLIGDTTDAEMEDLTKRLLVMSQTFGMDVNELAMSSSLLMRNGIAQNGQEATDMLMAAFQRVPPAMRGELMPIVDEYGGYLTGLGFTGQEAMGLIVNASQNGAIGMDKMGDALKEFQIRATDMSKTTGEAYAALGMDQTAMTNRLLAGGEDAKAAFREIMAGLEGIKDPAARSQAALALFGTPLEDLGVDKIPQFLAQLNGADSAMAEFQGSVDEAGAVLGGGPLNAIQTFGREMQNKVVGLLGDNVLPLFGEFTGALEDSEGNALAAAASMVGLGGVMGGFEQAKGVFDSVKEGVVGVKDSLVSAKDTATQAWSTMKDAGGWVKTQATAVGSFVKTSASATVEAVKTAASWTAAQARIIGGWIANAARATATFIATSASAALEAGKTAISWVVANARIVASFIATRAAMIASAVATGAMTAAQWLLNAALNANPIGVIIVALLALVGAIVWAWNNVDWFRNAVLTAWDWIQAAISWAWNNVIMPILNWFGQLFSALGAGIMWVWNNVIKVAWDLLLAGLQAVGKYFSWVWNSVIKPVWDALGAGIAWVVDNVVLPVWDRLKRALDLVKDSFGAAVDWIGQVWDRIKGIAAKPVKFVVDTVYNKGIRAAWNKVAGWLNLPELGEAPLGELGNYARGGVLPGYTPGRDVHDFYSPSGLHIGLSGGEAILRPEAARALGPGGVDSINAAARVGGPEAVRRELGQYAGGGIVDSIVDKVHRFFPGMSITSTYRDTNDLHGQGKAVDFSNGTDTTPQMQAAARFFHDNYGPMLAELIHYPLNGWQNIDEGRPFDFGAATNAQHRNHVHVAAHAPLPEPGTPITPISSGGGGGLFGWLRNRVADAFEGVMNPIGNAIPDFGGGDIGKLPKLAFDKFKTGVGDFLRGKADEVEPSTGYADPGGGDVQRWRPLVEELLGLYGHPLTWADLTLRRMNQESGGNPRAINNWDVNAANGTPSKGLMQVIDPTFQAYRDPAFVNDIWDPRANIAASMRYATARYGSLPAAYNRAGGYDDGGIASGRGIMLKDIIRPERVLDPEMTRSFDEKLIPILDRLTSLSVDDVLTASDRNALVSVDLSGAQIYGQYIEQQHVVDDKATARSVRRETKRAMVEAGLG
ncbi:tail tape measure protein [Rhodococcus rhodochrous ATCC 21198]|uniref:transglycosylase SLT domain-containing protein n=7 Tax=Rhodococcus aetherivorans TaxID=191292 RepID=UPI0003E2ABE9|nr:tail tape measure protein [Rhodococcus rhodochrous ATCC 21198]